MKDVTFDPMEKMLRGFDIAANAVVGTLGPKGRNVFIDDSMAPKITNDGATIAQNIVLPDKVENMGAYLVRNTSSQTNDDAGDGTTTTAALLQALVHQCMERSENPMEIKDSLKDASIKVLDTLKKKAVPIGLKDVHKVALISAENKQLASHITDIFTKLGDKAVANVEDSFDFETSYEIVEGYEAHVGFMSPAFITDNKRARAVFQDVPVFVTEKKISTVQDISPVFEQFKQAGITTAVIVAEDIDDSMLGIFVASKLTGKFNALVIRATGPLLQDIEAVVGATRVSTATGLSFDQVVIGTHLGRAKKIICDAHKTLFIADSTSAKDWANHLEKSAETEPNMYAAKKLRERVGKLRGGVAVLRIGAHTDFERDYLKLKAEDAVKAVQAALEEGIVEGGGMTYWRIGKEMKPKTVGEIILKRVLTQPLRKIIENAGKDYADIVSGITDVVGYDAKNDKYVDMMKEGIIDPAKVERCALENAVSAASTFITTFATITQHEEKKSTS